MRRKLPAVIADSIIVLLSTAIFFGQSGCAHMPKPPSQEMRAQFGTIGIVSSPSNPKIQFRPEFAKGRLSGAGKGAALGTGAGALRGLSLVAPGGSCSGQGCGVVVIIAAASAAVGGVMGGVYGGITGAVNAVPKGEARKIEGATRNILDGIAIQETMTLRVFKNLLDLPDYTFTLLGQEDFMIATPYDFSLLKERRIDTLLELNVKGGGFKEGKGKDPSMALFMRVHARLIRTVDEKEIYSRQFEYKSPKHRSTDWFDMDARLLREEIDTCFKELPGQIVEELFGRRPL